MECKDGIPVLTNNPLKINIPKKKKKSAKRPKSALEQKRPHSAKGHSRKNSKSSLSGNRKDGV